MQRRTLLRLGLGSAVVLALAGGGLALVEPGLMHDGRLGRGAREVMRHVARAVLDGLLPVDAMAQRMALDAQLERLDAAIAPFPAATRAELSQLLALLAAPPGRWSLAGLRTSWEAAPVEEVAAALQSMRLSGLALRQQAYHALRDLTNAAWFAERAHWQALGYDGPVPV